MGEAIAMHSDLLSSNEVDSICFIDHVDDRPCHQASTCTSVKFSSVHFAGCNLAPIFIFHVSQTSVNSSQQAGISGPRPQAGLSLSTEL